jgi:branched-subunit amino acid transport protein
MSMMIAILLASAAVYSWKFFGFLVPERFLEKPVVSRIAALLTVALLSALMATQALTKDGQIVFDARIASMGVAALLLKFKAPFLVVVAAAAATAALLRWLMP